MPIVEVGFLNVNGEIIFYSCIKLRLTQDILKSLILSLVPLFQRQKAFKKFTNSQGANELALNNS